MTCALDMLLAISFRSQMIFSFLLILGIPFFFRSPQIWERSEREIVLRSFQAQHHLPGQAL